VSELPSIFTFRHDVLNHFVQASTRQTIVRGRPIATGADTVRRHDPKALRRPAEAEESSHPKRLDNGSSCFLVVFPTRISVTSSRPHEDASLSNYGGFEQNAR
jgi:hypothetical protein